MWSTGKSIQVPDGGQEVQLIDTVTSDPAIFPASRGTKLVTSLTPETCHSPFGNFFFFFNYKNMITHLQETWKVQNKFTYVLCAVLSRSVVSDSLQPHGL